MKAGLPLIKIERTPLVKSDLIPLGLTAAASATNVAIQKTFLESRTTALIISNKEIKDIMKIFKLLEESALLIKRISETIGNGAK